jgi:hypothetical protein
MGPYQFCSRLPYIQYPYTHCTFGRWARHHDDPLKEVHRVIDLAQVYGDPRFFLATPTLIAPSTEKIVYSGRFDEFWRGMGSRGAASFRMVIVGYSLPPSDDYAKQVIYRLVRNYQNIPGERIDFATRPQRVSHIRRSLPQCGAKTQGEKTVWVYRLD